MSFFALIERLQNGPPPPWLPGVLTDREFAAEVARLHNVIRRHHQAYDLRLHPELTRLAADWAERLTLGNDLKFSGNKLKNVRVGENLAMKWTAQGYDYSPREVCEQWYSEAPQHDFHGEPTGSHLTTGHFSNMVWKNSTCLGVGRCRAADGRAFVVAAYWPPGNVVNEFSYNVLPGVDGGFLDVMAL